MTTPIDLATMTSATPTPDPDFAAATTALTDLIPMVYIPAGSFLMGSPENEPERFHDEGPQHEVTLGAFFMAKTPITQAQWQEVAGWGKVAHDLNPNPSHFKGDQRPVESVSWFDAMEFCHRLSQRTGRCYALPSEAQWEYACRAGSKAPFAFGDTLTPDLANYDGNYVYGSGPKGQYRRQTTDVASFPANPWGLHDMHGNVWEWCLDKYHRNYNEAPTDGSAWAEGDSLGKCCAAVRGSTTPGTAARLSATTSSRASAAAASVSASVASSDAPRLLRGGSWPFNPRNCRSAYRNFNHPDSRNFCIGFRVCCLPQDQFFTLLLTKP